jgi:hypothetical protein
VINFCYYLRAADGELEDTVTIRGQYVPQVGELIAFESDESSYQVIDVHWILRRSYDVPTVTVTALSAGLARTPPRCLCRMGGATPEPAARDAVVIATPMAARPYAGG